MPSFGGEVKPSVPMYQICSMLKNPMIYEEVGITGQIDRQFLARNSILHFTRAVSCRLTWSASGDDGRN
jgi:hypothetical protein